MPRPHVSVFLAISLDGYIAGPDGDLSWLAVCAGDSTAATGYDALFARVDTLLIGRATYEAVRGFPDWPFAGKRVVVATHRPIAAAHGEVARAGTLEGLLDDLHAEGARAVYLDGGNLVAQGLDAGLVDELTLSLVPVILGGGVPLFRGERARSDWRLVDTRRLPSGLVQVRYRPATAPAEAPAAR